MDKYTKLAKIGKGSFGCAYLAVRKSDPHGKQLVIKEIRMDPRDQQTALREAKLLAALDHPNIIACKESFLLGSPTPPSNAPGRARPPPLQVLCIVTEFADDGDLRKRLERGPRMREVEILDLFVQLCLALKHLHDRKIIHRDIKPENVFLTRANVVKLGDFGVATVLSHTLACAETLTGTPYYTSPEICLGRRYNHKTDVWSLGCVLFELAAFAHAFDGRSQRQLFDNIVTASAPVMPASAGVSARFADLVTEMLRKNPRDRPSVNQILKRPIVMERIQGFLTHRAIADELNHTVLHGHDIFRDGKPSARVSATPPLAGAGGKSSGPSVAVNNRLRRADAGVSDRSKKPAPAATPRKKKKTLSGGGGGKPPSMLLLKKSRSFKKAAAMVASPTPAPAVVRVSSASPATLEHRNRLLLQKKRAVVEKAKQEAMRARLAMPPPPPPTSSKNAPVAERVSAFNAQWRVQRQQLAHHFPLPPPPAPTAIGADGKKNPNAPAKKISEYPSPVVTPKKVTGAAVVKAAAANQRDLMRKDIRSRKLELQKRAGASASPHWPTGSPLDDPIILVQNLPDYAVMEPPESPTTTSDDSPDVVVTVPATPNLEFERMVLQLKSVVECCSDLDNEDESNDEDEDESAADTDRHGFLPPGTTGSTGILEEDNERDEADAPTAAACAPLPPTYDHNAPTKQKLSVLKLSMLEDPSFTHALRALLTANGKADIEDAVLAMESSLELRQALLYMRAYISSLTQPTLEK